MLRVFVRMKGRGGAGTLHLLAGSFSPAGYSMVQVLLGRGEDPNSKDEDGLTPVHVATVWGNYEALKQLLLAGGNPELCDSQKKNSFDYAVEEEQWDCLRLLNWWKNPDWKDICPTESTVPRTKTGGTGVITGALGVVPQNKSPKKISHAKKKRRELRLGCCSPLVTLTFCSDTSRSVSPPYVTAEDPSFAALQPHYDTQFQHDLSEICSAVDRSMRIGDSSKEELDLESTVRSVEAEAVQEIDRDILRECLRSDDESLRKSLTDRGVDVGPITARTKWLYARRLAAMKTEDSRNKLDPTQKTRYSPELNQFLAGTLSLKDCKVDETLLDQCFNEPTDGRSWREGSQKMSFCYLLLDSTVTGNLPERSKSMTFAEAFCEFLRAVFYVGKGKKSRPYHHLIEAAECRSNDKKGAKVEHILSLWGRGRGVVSVHVFHNIIPVDAYTREAAMIDAIGIDNLTNVRRGDYYGLASTWTSSRRRKFGVFLLERAMNIFFLEGERELFLADVQ